MPLPTPRDGESHDEFLARCMADETMREDFPTEEQRVAVCEAQWREREEGSMTSLHYQHVLSFVSETPWAILPAKLAEIVSFLAARATAPSADAAQIEVGVASRPAQPHASQGVAVLPVYGTIVQRGGLLVQASGGTSTERLGQMLQQAVADPSVGAIVLDMDSPGGAVPGIPELADALQAARAQKPIFAVANSLAASAAYWLASQADELVVTPSAEVGAIGVLAAHEDISVALEQRGVRVTLIAAGKYKAEAMPFGPLSDEARAAIQARVDDYYEMFVRAVARGRGVSADAVRNGFGEGRVVGARDAVRLGMADRVETLDATLRRVAGSLKNGRLRPAAETGWPPVAIAEPRYAAGPIAPHRSNGIADDDAEWDAGAEVARAEGRDELRRMHAWVDAQGDPDAKASYKIPHHRADGTLVPRGLFAAAQRLGQTDIPSADVPGVRRHLAGHYHELGRRAPWEGAEASQRRRRLRLWASV